MPDERGRPVTIALTHAGREAGDRLLEAGSIRGGFASLDLGWTMEDVRDYLEVSRADLGLGDAEFARLIGVCMGFAMTCVLQDRRRGVRSDITEGSGT